MITNDMIQQQLPIFADNNYDRWCIQIRCLFGSQNLWKLVKNGYNEVANHQEFDAQPQACKYMLLETRKKDQKVLYFIYQALDLVVFERICRAKMEKEAWDLLKITHRGVEKMKKVRLQTLWGDFEKLKMEEDETIVKYFDRIISISNQMRLNKKIWVI